MIGSQVCELSIEDPREGVFPMSIKLATIKVVHNPPWYLFWESPSIFTGHHNHQMITNHTLTEALVDRRSGGSIRGRKRSTFLSMEKQDLR